MKTYLRSSCAFVFALACVSVLAQNYPVKPVRMIVHFPPGGPTDIVARAVAQKLTDAWGYQFVIDNRPSAGGIVGVELVARAVPDGYTLLFGTGGSMAITPALDRKLPYDVARDFAPISLVVINPQILVFHPAFPPNSVKDLIAYAKTRPGTINYASVGPGSPQHLGVEMLKSMTGIDLVHIPYKGTAPAMTDVLAGQIPLMFNSMPTVLQHIKSGKLKGIAVGSAKRSPAMPDIPTVAESGVTGFDYVTWYGMFAPAATPKPVVAKLNAEVVKMLSEREMSQRLAVQGADPAPSTPEQLGRYRLEEENRWRKVIKSANLKLD
ncbi:MAG TPA: tripartite tricarboxylate transporter substrate binding protein [Burkholderiales bacterium]|nr:tripartite tricarboxylate transporter substrate binding protein [Burkholderiales bacterium]